ncbi:hypothetical protein Nepgr_027208 [Nepenthes gracilis]|uniref:Uncharacterized protein n=1 Tax=Nepenthes gracilis TaxID=150966 RepID=A0AAD3Y2Q8_NEPGR|nr:hypothetical protein Nepgr_027208 [Nepenthes gracilis]
MMLEVLYRLSMLLSPCAVPFCCLVRWVKSVWLSLLFGACFVEAGDVQRFLHSVSVVVAFQCPDLVIDVQWSGAAVSLMQFRSASRGLKLGAATSSRDAGDWCCFVCCFVGCDDAHWLVVSLKGLAVQSTLAVLHCRVLMPTGSLLLAGLLAAVVDNGRNQLVFPRLNWVLPTFDVFFMRCLREVVTIWSFGGGIIQVAICEVVDGDMLACVSVKRLGFDG